MVFAVPESKFSLRKASALGVAVGTAVFLLVLVAGIVFESWSVGEFLSNLTLETGSWLVLFGGMVIATFALPIALYLHSRIVTPLVLLGVIGTGWLVVGVSSGVIGAGAIFGLSLYAVGLSPLYVVLYLVLGGGEYYARKRGRA